MQDGRQERREIRDPRQRHLPRLRAHSEQARELSISEEEVVKNETLRETVDGEFTTVADGAEVALLLRTLLPANQLS